MLQRQNQLHSAQELGLNPTVKEKSVHVCTVGVRLVWKRRCQSIIKGPLFSLSILSIVLALVIEQPKEGNAEGDKSTGKVAGSLK